MADQKFKSELPLFLNIYKYGGGFADDGVINTDIKDLCTVFKFNFDELVINHIGIDQKTEQNAQKQREPIELKSK